MLGRKDQEAGELRHHGLKKACTWASCPVKDKKKVGDKER